MNRWLSLAAMLLFLLGCSGSGKQVKSESDPVKGGGKKGDVTKPESQERGVKLWRRACYHMTRRSVLADGDPTDLDRPVGEGDHDDIERCVEGIMSLPRRAPDLASRCALKADTQEDIALCVEEAVIDAKGGP